MKKLLLSVIAVIVLLSCISCAAEGAVPEEEPSPFVYYEWMPVAAGASAALCAALSILIIRKKKSKPDKTEESE